MLELSQYLVNTHFMKRSESRIINTFSQKCFLDKSLGLEHITYQEITGKS